MAARAPLVWTNKSVLEFAEGRDPIAAIIHAARTLALEAIQSGWSGPPFDPLLLAEQLDLALEPTNDVMDARAVPFGTKGIRIEFNPNRPKGRLRFSIAHEVAHTLFPDCRQVVRNRAREGGQPDDWQLELLCNIAAGEILMPIGSPYSLDREPVRIENLLRLRREYGVSMEAILLRVAALTPERCEPPRV